MRYAPDGRRENFNQPVPEKFSTMQPYEPNGSQPKLHRVRIGFDPALLQAEMQARPGTRQRVQLIGSRTPSGTLEISEPLTNPRAATPAQHHRSRARSTFIQELKKRRVCRVAIAYVLAGAAIVQVVGTVLPAFHSPDWAQQAFLVLVALGFPMALVLAWCFDVKAGGIKTAFAGRGHTAVVNQRRLWMLAAIGSGAAVLLVIAGWSWKPFARSTTAAHAAALDAATLPLPENAVAVLPFENLSDDKDYDFMVKAVQDQILADLAGVSGFKVISRTSVMRYRPELDHNLRAIARELGVSHVLEGTLQHTNGRIRLSVQLIDARSDTHVWGAIYDRDAADIFATENELAEQVAGEVKIRLTPGHGAAMALKDARQLTAYQPPSE